MHCEVEIRPVEDRFVPVGAIGPDLRVVGHQLRRHIAHEGERPDMGADPIRQALRQRRLGIGVVGAPIAATKICAVRTSPAPGSIRSTVCPA